MNAKANTGNPNMVASMSTICNRFNEAPCTGGRSSGRRGQPETMRKS